MEMKRHMPYDKTSMWMYIYMGMREPQLLYLSIERLESCHMPESATDEKDEWEFIKFIIN